MEQINAAHPDMFRTVIPVYIVTDLLLAVVFALLFLKAGAALGGGLKAGVALGVFVAILSPVVGNLHEYYSVRYLPVGLMAAVSIFQAIAHAVEGVSRRTSEMEKQRNGPLILEMGDDTLFQGKWMFD